MQNIKFFENIAIVSDSIDTSQLTKPTAGMPYVKKNTQTYFSRGANISVKSENVKYYVKNSFNALSELRIPNILVSSKENFIYMPNRTVRIKS
jgi:hypothetical protein